MAPRLQFMIRPACRDDLPAVIALEAATFGADGITPYDERYFRAWLRTNNRGFLVAEHEGEIAGYLYMQSIWFDPWHPPAGLTYNSLTGDGFTVTTHDDDGDCCHAISLGSIKRGAGRALMEEGARLAALNGQRYYFCFSRLSGFAGYLESHPDLKALADADPAAEEQLAFWYARENGRITNGLVWPEVALRDLPTWPPVEKPDPVLGTHLKVTGFGLLGVVPKCMTDLKSRDFAGLMAKKLIP